ncbi:MAG: hypothetical protein ACTTH5_05210 [Wolinella sp.]
MRKIALGLAVLVSLTCAEVLTYTQELDKKCNNGDNHACATLGKGHLFGEGVGKNYKKASMVSRKITKSFEVFHSGMRQRKLDGVLQFCWTPL